MNREKLSFMHKRPQKAKETWPSIRHEPDTNVSYQYEFKFISEVAEITIKFTSGVAEVELEGSLISYEHEGCI